jgi:ankyrin repeat protein
MVTAVMGHLTAARDGLLEAVQLGEGVKPPSSEEGVPPGGESGGASLTSAVDVNAQDDRGLTALHYAVEAGHELFVEMLARKGGNLQARGAPESGVPEGAGLLAKATSQPMRTLLARLMESSTDAGTEMESKEALGSDLESKK